MLTDICVSEMASPDRLERGSNQRSLSICSTPLQTLADRARSEVQENSSTDDDTDESSDAEEEPAVSQGKRVKIDGRKEKTSDKSGHNWAILETIWPATERPGGPLTNKKYIESMPITALLDLYKIHAEQEKKEAGQAISKASKDKLPPVVTVAKMKDNCFDKLSEARWFRTPISKPSTWFKNVPLKRTVIYRNIPLKHLLGTDTVVAKNVIMTMHDRRNALQLKHFNRTNSAISSKPMKEIRGRDTFGISIITGDDDDDDDDDYY